MLSLGERMKDPHVRGWAALLVLVLVVVTLAWPFAVSRDARHLTAYAGAGEDLSALHDQLGGTVKDIQASPHLLSSIKEPSKTVLLIVGPERRYDASETQAILDFLAAGGKVILADETGFGTDISGHAGYAFSAQRVLDSQHNYQNDPKLVVAKGAPDGNDIVFIAPASLVTLSGADVANDVILASSSPPVSLKGSYLDTNGNGEIDIADQPGPFPLIVRTHVGAGTLVLVADTGLFMNEQLDLGAFQNGPFLRGLVAQTLGTTEGTVIIDESRHAPTALVAPYENAARTLARATGGPIAPFILLAVLIVGGFVAWRFTHQTEDWSHHQHDVGHKLDVPQNVRPDLARAQRMARYRVSERFNIPLERVAAMTTEELQAITGDKMLAETASGALRSDPAPLFRSFSTPTESAP
jgi:hypothetical protein